MQERARVLDSLRLCLLAQKADGDLSEGPKFTQGRIIIAAPSSVASLSFPT